MSSKLSIDSDDDGQRIHRLVFGKTYADLRADFDIDSTLDVEDDSGPVKAEYGHTYYVLQRLETSNPDEFTRFIGKLEAVTGLDDLDFTTRCRLVYTLLASTIDWKDTRAGRLASHGTIAEMPYGSVPPLDLDFQAMTDSVRAFRPSPEQASNWGEVFSHVLRQPKAPPQAAQEIVRGGGSKIRTRKKRSS
jgi:hypothetical protein